MSTQSTVWKQNTKGNFNGVMFHSDGYPTYMGVILNNCFKTTKATTEIMKISRKYKTDYLSRLYTPKFYKDAQEYKTSLIRVGEHMGLEHLSLSNTDIIVTPNSNLNNGMKNIPMSELSTWGQYNYYQKDSGKWYLISNLDLGNGESVTVNVPLDKYLSLIKKGIIARDDEIILSKRYSKDLLVMLLKQNEFAKESIDAYKRLISLDFSKFYSGHLKGMFREFIQQSDIDTSLMLLKSLNISNNETQYLYLIKNHVDFLTQYKKEIVNVVVNELQAINNNALNHVSKLLISQMPVKDIIELGYKSHKYNLFIAYDSAEELAKYLTMSKQELENTYTDRNNIDF